MIACAPSADAPIRSALTQMGVEYCELPVDRAGLNPARDFQLMVSLHRLMRESMPDIVLSYTAKPVIYGSLMARLCSVPAVFALITGLGYGFTATGVKASLTRAMLRRLYRVGLRESRAVFFREFLTTRGSFATSDCCGTTPSLCLSMARGSILWLFGRCRSRRRSRSLMIARLISLKGSP